MPPKKSSSDYMREVRDYIAQHGSAPVETPNTAGYALAKRIHVARTRGVFNAAQLAELDSGIPAPAAVQKKPAGAIAAAARVAEPKSAPAKTTPGKRGASPSQERSASAAAPMTSKRSKMPEVNLREGLFVDPQQGALSGMASSTTTVEICVDTRQAALASSSSASNPAAAPSSATDQSNTKTPLIVIWHRRV